MRPRRTLATVAVCVWALAACSGDDDERGLDPLDTPRFPAEEATGTGSTAPGGAAGGATTSTAATAATAAPTQGSTETTAPVAAGADPPAAPQRQVVSFDDPVGDAVGGLDDEPPAWADLAGARLVRNDDAFALSIRLGGGTVPQRPPEGRTMNVATFFDVTGDGTVDHEIWANLGPEGWGAAHYDNAAGGGGFGEESNVTVVVRDQTVELVFPDVLLDQAGTFRFSLASEYGGLDVLGSGFAHRDDAPDGDRAVTFP